MKAQASLTLATAGVPALAAKLRAIETIAATRAGAAALDPEAIAAMPQPALLALADRLVAPGAAAQFGAEAIATTRALLKPLLLAMRVDAVFKELVTDRGKATVAALMENQPLRADLMVMETERRAIIAQEDTDTPALGTARRRAEAAVAGVEARRDALAAGDGNAALRDAIAAHVAAKAGIAAAERVGQEAVRAANAALGVGDRGAGRGHGGGGGQ